LLPREEGRSAIDGTEMGQGHPPIIVSNLICSGLLEKNSESLNNPVFL
jgi:hypothetical protein